ncbi:Protein MAIN-LIKE 1 [Glycine max]|nr:Protein MAIN-LIKE 1 [Glycine max]
MILIIIIIIIVRTRGLRRALGRVLGRALGRHVHEEPQEPVTNHVATDTKGFPSGPQDASPLMDYSYHMATRVWAGEERTELKLASHGRKVEQFGRPGLEIEGIVTATGLSSLISYSLDTGDKGLLSAFVERWHKETGSFHLPVMKVSITLDDVAYLLHLPNTGAFLTVDALDVDQVVELLVELLGVSTQEAKDETDKYDARQWTLVARTYLLHLVGCTLFANKSVTHINVVFLDAFRDLNQSRSYSWGAIALVHMYDNLNDASKHKTKHLCWIYEHFPTIASIFADEDYHERNPRACRWKSRKALPVSTYRKL